MCFNGFKYVVRHCSQVGNAYVVNIVFTRHITTNVVKMRNKEPMSALFHY